MADAFDKAWNLSKIDFRFDDKGVEGARGYSSPGLGEYKYRVPIGYDSEGNLKYSPRDRSVTDNSFVQLSEFFPYGPVENKIIGTIMHEAMHDADLSIGSPARAASRARGPEFLGRGPRYHAGVFNSAYRGRSGLNPPTTRDKNFAAETMAYLGTYPDRPDLVNIATMDHPDVKPSDIQFMYDKLPAEPVFTSVRDALRSRNRRRDAKGLKRARRPSILRDPETGEVINEFEEDFVVPRTEQIRRNLVNALRDMAMTRMIESGEFRENPETNRYEFDMKGDRPDARKIKAAERETSKARNAINRFFRKVEAGDEPVPRSMEDLPEKIRQLVGQQQIRQLVGEQRGLGSEADVNRRSEFDEIQGKIAHLLNPIDTPTGVENKFDNLPLEEKKELLSEYLGFINDRMRPVKYDAYGYPRRGDENVDDYGHVQATLRERDEDGNLIYQDVIDEHLTDNVKQIFNDYVADYKGGKPGPRTRIKPVDRQREEMIRDLRRYYGGDDDDYRTKRTVIRV